MNKNDLIKEISCRLSVTQAESIRFLNAWQDIVERELEKGEGIMLQGFGAFSLWKQTERLGRNPRNGVPCVIRSRCSVKFRPGKAFLSKLNRGKDGKDKVNV